MNTPHDEDRRPMGRRFLGILVAAAVLGLVVVATVGTTGGSQAAAQTVGFPVSLAYSLDYEDGFGGELARFDFDLVISSWDNWRMTVTCCDEYTGYIQEQRPDGTTWSGYVSWSEGLMKTNSGETDGAVPLPDFSQGRPYDEADLADAENITLLPEVAADYASDFGLRSNDVFAYRFAGGVASVEGMEEDLSLESVYVVYKPLRVPIFLEERENGRLIRRLKLLQLEALATTSK